MRPLVAGWRCAVCGTAVDIATVAPWRCPNALHDDRHHLLQLVRGDGPVETFDHPNPFIAWDSELAWSAFARAHGMSLAARHALVREIDASIQRVCGTGFVVTPLRRADTLSDALGFTSQGGVWVKDETGNVAGSHKARHLMTILLHLRACEYLGLLASPRQPLAIASCGNAALAAATLAKAVEWPLRVFVPPAASPSVLSRLEELGADVVMCPRSADDAPGDPCIHRFREAVDDGAVPFSVQGPENALCLDGGRTLGWELLAAASQPLDRVFIQVGGGAFASSVGSALLSTQSPPRLDAVQTEGCAPLARAWRRANRLGFDEAAHHWDECMGPWEHPQHSVADGILDDETYDWLGVVRAMHNTGGEPIVVPERLVVEAHELATRHTGVAVSPTGSAGLAGLLEARDAVDDSARVAVVFSGVAR